MPKSRWQLKATQLWGKRGAWIDGDGRFAVLAHCRVLTVSLWERKEEAARARAGIDHFGCGGACSRNHEIVDLQAIRPN